MDSEFRSRFAKGLSAQAFAKISSTIIQLASVPLLLSYWGADVYGAWLILTAIPAYLAMSDLGFAAAAQAEMTMAVGRGDRDAAIDIFQGTWLLVSVLSVTTVLVIGGLASFAPLAGWFNIAALPNSAVIATLWLLGFSVLISVQCSLVYVGFHSHGRYGLGLFLLGGIRIFEFILLTITVLLGGGPVAAAGAWLVSRVIGTIVMRLILRRAVPTLSFGWDRARLVTMKRLARPAMASLALPLGAAMNIQGIVIVIGALFSPATVVVFSTLRTMTRFGNQLVTALCTNVAPEISTAYGDNNTALVQKLHNRVCQAALWITVCIAVGLLIVGKPLLSLWTLDAVAMNWPIFITLLAIMVIYGVSFASMMLVYATNRHMRIAVVYLMVNIVLLGGAYMAGPWLGLAGIAVILLIAEIVIAGFVISQSLRLLGESPAQFIRAVLQSPLPMIAWFFRPK